MADDTGSAIQAQGENNSNCGRAQDATNAQGERLADGDLNDQVIIGPVGNIPPALLRALRPITLVTGHYGTGKTNFALNLALDLAEKCDVTLVDLDIVNPYFRSSEYESLFEGTGVRVVGPVMANSSLDTPSLSAAVDGVIDFMTGGQSPCHKNRIAIIDVGGDDAGAMALGRYRARIQAQDYAMLYVVNANRNLTQDPADALQVLREIEVTSGLRATGIVNNTHLRTLTTTETITGAADFGKQVAALANVPLVAQTTPDWCASEIGDTLETHSLYSVNLLVKLPWETPAAESI